MPNALPDPNKLAEACEQAELAYRALIMLRSPEFFPERPREQMQHDAHLLAALARCLRAATIVHEAQDHSVAQPPYSRRLVIPLDRWDQGA